MAIKAGCQIWLSQAILGTLVESPVRIAKRPRLGETRFELRKLLVLCGPDRVCGFSVDRTSFGGVQICFGIESRSGVVLRSELVSAVKPCVVGGHYSSDLGKFKLYIEDFDCVYVSSSRHLEYFSMPPRRRGRPTRQISIESEAQNEEVERSIPVRRRTRQVADEVDVLAARVDEMELIMEMFQRMNPQTFNGDESSSDAESWLQHITRMFDRVRYDIERRRSLATFQLRKNAEGWWRGASRNLEETGVRINLNSFCIAFCQETGFLHQPALEGLTRSARMDSPRQDWPETIFRRRDGRGGGGQRARFRV
ncbi:hypothetical protein F511_18053 [Dorcoceras hygrometricum]|uniref:Uncharacterized protein n=1 Tax=Dorcoceras hygrometricum TaxID=472368 RepID=A0A2Z7BXG9_9LAMI|nr:hypothetical protein F511_18053 [Dorcoceras hygrometricum]